MKHPIFQFSVVFALALLTAGAAVSQRPVTPRRLAPPQQQNDERAISSGLTEAMRMLSGDPDGALKLLHQLDLRFPENDRILTRLGYVKQVGGDADSAEAYYRRALTISPANLETGKFLGTLLLSLDRDRDAAKVFSELIEANGEGLNAYRTVGMTYRDLGRYQDALDIYERGRGKSNQHSVLTLEIAALQRAMGNYTAALDEYLSYMGDRRRNYRFCRDEILHMVREADDAEREQLIPELERYIDRGRGRYVLLDVLSAYYLQVGQLEKSLNMALAADEEKGSDGVILLALSEQILSVAEAKPRTQRRGYLELAIRALGAFSDHHPRAAGTDRALYMLATTYTEFGSVIDGITAAERKQYLDKAVAAYGDLSKRYPNSEYAERAYLDRGELELHLLKNADEALNTYKIGSVNARRFGDLFAERICQLYLGLGRFDDARNYLDTLAKSGTAELERVGTFYSALLLVYEKKYDAGKEALVAICEADLASPYANNALEAVWVVQEALQFGSNALDTYLEAQRAELVGDTTRVVENLNRIVDMPVYEPLRPRAMYHLGSTLNAWGRTGDASALLQRFMKEYPDDDLRPDVQRLIAEIYESGEKFDLALEAYEAVLVSYPDYAFLDEVRKDVRRLRFIVKGEEYEE